MPGTPGDPADAASMHHACTSVVAFVEKRTGTRALTRLSITRIAVVLVVVPNGYHVHGPPLGKKHMTVVSETC